MFSILTNKILRIERIIQCLFTLCYYILAEMGKTRFFILLLQEIKTCDKYFAFEFKRKRGKRK